MGKKGVSFGVTAVLLMSASRQSEFRSGSLKGRPNLTCPRTGAFNRGRSRYPKKGSRDGSKRSRAQKVLDVLKNFELLKFDVPRSREHARSKA